MRRRATTQTMMDLTRPGLYQNNKAALLHAKQAQRTGRGIDLPVLDPDERDPVPIL